MANYYARSAGNVNDAIWATSAAGTPLASTPYPFTTADTLYANNNTVQLNVNTSVLEIRTDATNSAVAGGGFVIYNGVTLNANVYSGSSNCVTMLNSSVSATINGNITGASVTGAAASGVVFNSSGTLTVTGTVKGGTNTTNSCYGITATTAGATINVTGDVIGGLGGGASNGINLGTTVTLNLSNSTLSSLNSQAIIAAGAANATLTNVTVGSFGINWGSSGTLTITGTSSVTSTNALVCIALSNGVANIAANLSSAGGGNAISQTGGIVNVTGNLTTGTTHCVVNTTGALTINGNATGGATANQHAAYLSGAGSIAITGTVTAGTAASYGAINAGTGTFTINGNVVGNGTSGAINNSTGTMIINGTATGGANGPGATNNSTGTMTVTRAKGNGYGIGSSGLTAQVGVANTTTGLCYVKEIEYGDLGMSPTSGAVIMLDLTSNVALLYRSGLSKQTLIDPNTTANLLPAASDVRKGVTYNNGSNTGTMAVPAASSVAAGVAVDATTGTAALTAATVWDELTSNTRVSGSYGERLKNAATTATTGQQIVDALN